MKGILALLSQVGGNVAIQFSHGMAVLGIVVGLALTGAALGLLSFHLIPPDVAQDVLEYGLSLTAFLCVAGAIKPTRNGGTRNARKNHQPGESQPAAAEVCSPLHTENKTGGPA